MDDVYWQRGAPPALQAPLDGDTTCDVVVVGGGVAGLTAARHLAAAGRDVVLLERGAVGSGASGRSSGFVTPDSELELSMMLGRMGPVTAATLWTFVTSGVGEIRSSIADLGVSCDALVERSVLLASTRHGAKAVRAERAAFRDLGLESTLYARDAVPSILGSTAFHAAHAYGGTFAIDPLAYCRGLCAGLVRAGVRVHESTAAIAAIAGQVATATGTVHARHVLVCADRCDPALGWLADDVSHLQTFLVATTPLSVDDHRRMFPSGPVMAWDTDLIYNYLRPLGDRRMLLGGGQLRSTYSSRTPDLGPVGARILALFRRRFPGAACEVDAVWAGQLGVSRDLLPVVARRDGISAVGAATGLPWAAALGRALAQEALNPGDPAREHLFHLMRPGRDHPIARPIRGVLGRPLSFALSHLIVKQIEG